MRHIASFIIIFLASVNAMAQWAFIGDWQGKVANIPIIIHVSNDDTGLKATLDSPTQGATGIPCGSVVVDGPSPDTFHRQNQVSCFCPKRRMGRSSRRDTKPFGSNDDTLCHHPLLPSAKPLVSRVKQFI